MPTRRGPWRTARSSRWALRALLRSASVGKVSRWGPTCGREEEQVSGCECPPPHFSRVPARAPPQSNNTTAMRGQKGGARAGSVLARGRDGYGTEGRGQGCPGHMVVLPICPLTAGEMGAWSLSNDDGRSHCSGTWQPVSSFTCRSPTMKTPPKRASLGGTPGAVLHRPSREGDPGPRLPGGSCRESRADTQRHQNRVQEHVPWPFRAAGEGDRSEEPEPRG